MLRKSIILLSVILCCLLLAACTSGKIDDNEKLVQMVIEKEINEYLFSTYQIPFAEYEENIKKLYYKDYSLDYIKSSDKPVIIHEDRKIYLKDILNYTEDDLKKLRQDFKEQYDEGLKEGMILPAELMGSRGPLEISRVYYDEDLKQKTVFVKNIISHEIPKEEVKYYRQYISREEDEKWKIWEMREYFHWGTKMPIPKAVELFSNYHGIEVEYPYTVDLSQYDKEWY